MLPETHPVIRALRQVCIGDVPRYEAIIAIMQEHFFKDAKLKSPALDHLSVQQFMKELFEEREMIYSAEETAKTLAPHHPEWVEKIFKTPPKRPRTSKKSKS